MRIFRTRPAPAFMIRETLLNESLSPAARLAYATLAADEDDTDYDMDRIARLVGVHDAEALEPILSELVAAGAVDLSEHHGQGLVLSVNLEPIPPAKQRPCVPCESCGICSCGYRAGLCEDCWVAQEHPPIDQDTAPQLDSRWVYAVSSEAEPKSIKIGVATDIRKRVKQLQIGSASPIVLRWQSAGGYALESHLHEKFTRLRIGGEWFDFQRTADPVKTIEKAAQAFLQQFDAS
jgi:hypothetical protein